MTFCWYCRVNYLVENQREKISSVNIFLLAAPVILVLICLYEKSTDYSIFLHLYIFSL